MYVLRTVCSDLIPRVLSSVEFYYYYVSYFSFSCSTIQQFPATTVVFTSFSALFFLYVLCQTERERERQRERGTEKDVGERQRERESRGRRPSLRKKREPDNFLSPRYSWNKLGCNVYVTTWNMSLPATSKDFLNWKNFCHDILMHHFGHALGFR